MKWVETKRDESIIRKREENERKLQNWADLDPVTRQEILAERAQRDQAQAKLRMMRQGFEDYQLDKQEALLTGQRFQPRMFTINKRKKIVAETSGRFMIQLLTIMIYSDNSVYTSF